MINLRRVDRHFFIIGYYPLGTIANGYAAVPQHPTFAASATGPLTYQTTIDPAIAYTQQLQQPQQAYLHTYQPNTFSQLQLAQLLALRQAQLAQAQQGQLQVQSEQVIFISDKIKAIQIN